ncbi:MAG TPA: L-2-hydroxyglutarate oxidase [Ignavibacteriaceae bacterium]|nr:L-2-hydroxyglutarate oxidase [Ignavibacteriaceae bacterium]
MSNSKIYDFAIIGGGIVGTATALSLQKSGKYSVVVLETESKVAAHQTGNNSGVIHSGLYYKPGSLKAQNCIAGRELMYRFCDENNIEYQRCGKIVIASVEEELPALDELERRGIANGLNGVKRLSREEIKEYEPYAVGVAGLFVPETGIVNYTEVTEAFAKNIAANGGEIRTNSRFISLIKDGNNLILQTTQGEVQAKFLVNCGGLHSDTIARICGVNPNLQIIPFRGEYYKLKKEKEYLVNNLIYPVPDPKFPFLGVHFTRMISGGVEAGPNAVLAFKREGYTHKDISFGDIYQMISYPGFWRMASHHYKMGINEFRRSLSKELFVKSLQKLVPSIGFEDVYREGAGVRAQALDPNGNLADDFRIVEAEKMVHILNAPSPAATASLSIGNIIAQKAIKAF